MVTQSVLRHNPEGLGFDSRCVIGILNWLNPSGCTIDLGSTQTLRICLGYRRPVRRANNHAALMSRLSRNSGSLKFKEP